MSGTHHGLGPIGSVGLIVQVENKLLTVVPMKYLQKIIMVFINGIDTHNIESETLPFTYVIKNNVAILDDVDKCSSLCSKDKIVSIDNQDICIRQKNLLLVYDEDYGKNIPLDIYAKHNFMKNVPVHIIVARGPGIFPIGKNSDPSDVLPPEPKNKIIELTFVLQQNNRKISFPLTDQPSFNPSDRIPFVNLNGLIIVKLTHEFLDIAIFNKVGLDSYAIDDILKGKNTDYVNTYMIIVCQNLKLVKKINYVGSMIVSQFNGLEIQSLSDFVRLRKKTGANKLIVYRVRNKPLEIII